jgi:CubicO group peptidase (beta-lactamase class C family)
MADWKMPGFAVGIVLNDSVIFTKGYGTKEFGMNKPVDEETQFIIASCSKAFLTASLAILVDQKKLHWDDPVTKYLPTFQMYDPWVTKELTIRDLVTHRSGLATFSGDFLWLGSDYNSEEVVRRARFLKPTSSFRSRYGYQNILFIAAAEVVKAITDTVWSDHVKEHILKPLKMNNTTTTYKEMRKASNVSKAHYEKNGEIKIYTDNQNDNAGGALGLNSCVKDVAQWIRLQLGKGKIDSMQIFSEQQWNEMTSNQMFLGSMNYGLGWFIRYWNGKKVLNHGGGMPGMISDVSFIPELKFGAVILSNTDISMTGAIRNYMYDLFTGAEPKDYSKTMLEAAQKRLEGYEKENKRREDVRVKDSKPSLPHEKYCGAYEDKMYGNAEVSLKNGELYLQFIPSKTFRGVLKHYHFDTFYIDWEDEFLTRGWVKFEMDFNAEIQKFTIEVPNSPDFIFTELLFEKAENKK